MTNSIRAHGVTSDLKTIVASAVSTSAKSPEEALGVLERLDRGGIESFVTETGDLLVRYWTIGAHGFVSPEHAAVIRSKRPSPEHENVLDWLSKNIADIQAQYTGQWIAIYANAVVAANPTLHELLGQIVEIDRPFITFIPREPVVWKFTYAHQKL
jgi:hypothetical protein